MPRPASQARKAKKRPKGFFKKSAGKRPRWEKKLDVGMKGVLLTCNRDERQCTREAYDLLNEYADELYGAEVAGTCDGFDSDEGDIADALEREVTEMNQQRNTKTMRFQAVDSRANNVIFIRTKINDDPANFVLHIVKKLKEAGQCRSQHIQRILPVSLTCRANLEQIEKSLKPLLEPVFHSAEAKDSSFSVLFKARNNNEIQKAEVVTVVANSVTSGAVCKHTVDLDSPDYFILVEIICNVCCLSVLKDYNLLRKYNVRALTGELMNMPGKTNQREGEGGGGVESSQKEPQGVDGVEQETVKKSATGEASAEPVLETSQEPGDEQKSDKTSEEPVEKLVAEEVGESSDSSKVDTTSEAPVESKEGDGEGDTRQDDRGGAEGDGETGGGIRIF